MSIILNNINNGIKELILPKQCFFCKKYGTLLCDDCQELLEISPIHRTQNNTRYLSDIYAACSYENKYAKKMIISMKYDPFWKELANPLAKLISDHLKLSEQNLDFKKFIIIPIPLSPKRLRWRGFNQSQIIASTLGKEWLIPVASQCLSRVRETQIQAGLKLGQRQENVKGAFVCAKNIPMKNKNVLLIDDVVTTRATMEECARVLKNSGVQQVIGVAVTHAKN